MSISVDNTKNKVPGCQKHAPKTKKHNVDEGQAAKSMRCKPNMQRKRHITAGKAMPKKKNLYGEKKGHASCHKHAQRQLNEAFSGEELELFQADQ